MATGLQISKVAKNPFSGVKGELYVTLKLCKNINKTYTYICK